MRRLGLGFGLALALAAPVAAADGITRTFAAPLERVFAAVETALDRDGWGVDHSSRPLGLIVTKSQRLAGDDDGIHAKNRRVRLRIQLAPAPAGQTTVSIVREFFNRERVLWVDKDEAAPARGAVGAPDRSLEQRVFADIGQAL